MSGRMNTLGAVLISLGLAFGMVCNEMWKGNPSLDEEDKAMELFGDSCVAKIRKEEHSYVPMNHWRVRECAEENYALLEKVKNRGPLAAIGAGLAVLGYSWVMAAPPSRRKDPSAAALPTSEPLDPS
jgi:hypothetical protein